MAERGGYTVSMFIVDTSPSMANMRTIELPPDAEGNVGTVEVNNLEWAMRYVKLKIQEMIFNGRKTDQCGVILCGSEITDNIVNKATGEGYENIQEYIKIAQPNIGTLAKLDPLSPSTCDGDPVDALVVALETQGAYLGKKKWSRKVFLVTDGETPLEQEGWQDIIAKMGEAGASLVVVGVDFDEPDYGFVFPDKSIHKTTNESFYKRITEKLGEKGVVGNLEHALQEVVRPESKTTRSALSGNILRIGDPDLDEKAAIAIMVKTSKCTSLARPSSLKKYGLREAGENDMTVDEVEDQDKPAIFSQLKMRSEYYVDRFANPEEEEEEEADDVKMEEDDNDALLLDGEAKPKSKDDTLERVEKEELVKGFKYGTTYVPCPDGQFPKRPTVKGIDILGFFPGKNFRRELAMGEVQYVWADPGSAQQQVALSSLVQAMDKGEKYAISRWVGRDGSDPKMGVLAPVRFAKVDALIWVKVPFAEDVRKFMFASLYNLVNKKGERIVEHPYLPTEAQVEAMDEFVDAMDLGDAGEKDEEGNRTPWFSTLEAFNPAVHRIKQAIFHSAVVSDIATNPLPPPHPELLTFWDPPKRVLKRAKKPLEECKSLFNVKEVSKRTAGPKKDDHTHAPEEEDAMLLLDRRQGLDAARTQSTFHTEAESASQGASVSTSRAAPAKAKAVDPNDSATEDEDDEEMLLLDNPAKKELAAPLPTPARSVPPAARHHAKKVKVGGTGEDEGGVDPGRAPGRIIGNTDPLGDFRKNIAQGDVVSKAVEDMGAVVLEIVLKPFAGRRTRELVECMTVLRKTCLEEDEVEAWNAFILDLKNKSSAKPGNTAFWKKIKEVGRPLSYISDEEAQQLGGSSQYTERQAEDLVS